MSAFSSAVSFFSKIVSPQVSVKSPTFNVTHLNKWDDYFYTTKSDKYLDQYVGWTYRATKIKAEAYAATPIYVSKPGRDGREEVNDDAVMVDLVAFNPHQSLYEARMLTAAHLNLAGMAVWHMFKSEERDHVKEFYILDPQRLQVNTDEFGLPRSYTYTVSEGEKREIALADIIIFRDPNPKNWQEGYSPLRAARFQHNTSEFGLRWNMNFFGNNAQPEGVLYFEGVTEKERDAIEKNLKAKYGGPENSGRVAIVNKKVEWTPLMLSQKDMQYLDGLSMMRDDILSINGVPKSMAGLNDSTYNNIREAQRIFQQYTLRPMLELEKNVLNEQLLPKYYLVSRQDKKKQLMFEFSDPVEMDFAENSKAAAELFSAGVISRAEAKKLVDLRPDDGDDELYIQDVQAQQVVEKVNENQKKAMKEMEERMKYDLNRMERDVYAMPTMKEYKKEKREELRRYFHQKSITEEVSFEKRVAEYFDGQLGRVLSGIRRKGAKIISDIEFNADSEVGIFIEMFQSVYQQMLISNTAEAVLLTGSETRITEAAKRKIQSFLKHSATEINKTTQEKIVDILENAVDNSWSEAQTSQAIMDVYSGYKESRAKTIARTEVNKVKNYSFNLHYAKNSYVLGREWLSAQDEDVRDAHQTADGQVRPKDEPFLVGGERLMYPGDPAGSAANIINCRCTLLPVME